MSTTKIIMFGKAAALLGAVSLMGTPPADALTMKECSAKFARRKQQARSAE